MGTARDSGNFQLWKIVLDHFPERQFKFVSNRVNFLYLNKFYAFSWIVELAIIPH